MSNNVSTVISGDVEAFVTGIWRSGHYINKIFSCWYPVPCLWCFYAQHLVCFCLILCFCVDILVKRKRVVSWQNESKPTENVTTQWLLQIMQIMVLRGSADWKQPATFAQEKHTLTSEQQGDTDELKLTIVLAADLLGVVLSPWWGFLLEERAGVGVGGPGRSTSRRVWKAWWFKLCSVRKRSVGFSSSRLWRHKHTEGAPRTSKMNYYESSPLSLKSGCSYV